MDILGIGVDIVEIARFDGAMQRQGQKFLDRLFLPSEQAFCKPQHSPARCYSARFAAKEAVSKALGTGIGADIGWRDIELGRKSTGQPFIILHGRGAETAAGKGITEILISLSHSEHYAVANAVAIGRRP